jgi:ABC-type lipoprotein release transport system permease subunit
VGLTSRLLISACASLVVAATIAIVSAPASAANLTPPSLPEVLLSRQLLQESGVHVGDVVTFALDERGSRATRFTVAGVYEPTPDPLKFSVKRLEARLHLPDLLAFSDEPEDPLTSETVRSLNVALVHPQQASSIAAKLVTRSLGLVARRTVTTTDDGEIFAVIDRFHRAIAVVTVVGSTAFLLALMVIRAEERRDIVGILRLMGIPPRSILVEVLVEGLLIAVGGAIFGVVVAALGQGAVNRFFQWRYDTTLRFVEVTIPIAVQSIAFAVPLGVVAGLAASWTLLHRDVVGLIRR